MRYMHRAPRPRRDRAIFEPLLPATRDRGCRRCGAPVLHTQTQGADIFATDRVTSRFNPNPIKRAINRYGSGNLGTPRISFEEGNPARRESRGYCAIAFGIAAVFAIDTTLPALQLGQA